MVIVVTNPGVYPSFELVRQSSACGGRSQQPIKNKRQISSPSAQIRASFHHEFYSHAVLHGRGSCDYSDGV